MSSADYSPPRETVAIVERDGDFVIVRLPGCAAAILSPKAARAFAGDLIDVAEQIAPEEPFSFVCMNPAHEAGCTAREPGCGRSQRP